MTSSLSPDPERRLKQERVSSRRFEGIHIPSKGINLGRRIGYGGRCAGQDERDDVSEGLAQVRMVSRDAFSMRLAASTIVGDQRRKGRRLQSCLWGRGGAAG